MKKFVLLVAFFVAQLGFGQEDALVFFADKENVAASLDDPIIILTQDAIDRKLMHNTPIDERDVPLNENYKTLVNDSPGIDVFAKCGICSWFSAGY
jgi:serine protease AprX